MFEKLNAELILVYSKKLTYFRCFVGECKYFALAQVCCQIIYTNKQKHLQTMCNLQAKYESQSLVFNILLFCKISNAFSLEISKITKLL